MELRSSLGSVATLALVAVIVAMLVGQQLGQPILFGFVVTGSMSPTLEPGDGFVAVPPVLADDIEEGDVVTFDARELQGGGLTTHRVVGETDEGYVTRGDANPFTDQDGDEPPVQESQIVSVALQFDGELVVIPSIGTVALALQGAFGAVMGVLSGLPGGDAVADGNVETLMVGGGVLLLLYSFAADLLGSDRGGRDRSRSRRGATRAGLVLAVILLLILVPATASMVIPSGVNEITVVSSESPSSNPTTIERGGSQTVTYNISNSGVFPQVAIIEPASTGVEVAETTHWIWRGQSAGTTATIHAPDETGVYYRSISERQYLGLLPLSVIVALHAVHPVVAIAAIDLVIAVVVTVVFALAVGFQPLRFRDTGRDTSVVDTVRRTVRKWL
ncbi:signal peptidase I [Halorubrum sp. AJ67]|uniref:signal peptidase I n=1 Tax=Halorubrum sp. AJ67 TaxID=1173487 RepID=UPI0003DC571C|nr:signal peptidase I [Halorubrum sp. AJ67]CDK39297.1 signal peptidase I [Halorubrum sp. AJ67]